MLPVSIVIRTYGPERLPAILRAISEQADGPYEVKDIIIVNGAPHLPVDMCVRDMDSKVVVIQNSHLPYRPGQALNLGIRHATGSVIVFLSGHSLPASPVWLKSLLEAMHSHQVAGVCGSQVPYEQSNCIEYVYRRVWYGSSHLADTFRQFNLANAAIRRQYWDSLPFDETLEGCEDRHWSHSVRKNFQATFAFCPNAAVYHSHVTSYLTTCRYFAWLLCCYIKSVRQSSCSKV